MTVRAPIFVSTAVVAAVLSLGSHHVGSEPLNSAGAARSERVSDKAQAAPGARTTLRLSARALGKAVSATRQLDLKKLTMADFGDIEPTR